MQCRHRIVVVQMALSAASLHRVPSTITQLLRMRRWVLSVFSVQLQLVSTLLFCSHLARVSISG